MRTIPAPELDLWLYGDTAVRELRVRVKRPGDASWTNLSDTLGGDWVLGVRVEGDTPDQPTGRFTVQFLKHAPEGSASPGIEASDLNTDASLAFRPILYPGRSIEVDARIDAEPWRLWLQGEIEDVEWGGPEVVATCLSLDGVLFATQIEEEEPSGAADPGNPIEDEIQDLLDRWMTSPPTLLVVGTPDWGVAEYTPPLGSLGEHLRALAQRNGWDLRYKWSEADSNYRLTLYLPDRDKTVADFAMSADLMHEVPGLRISRQYVRNAIIVHYANSSGVEQAPVEVTDATSITEYGRRAMVIQELSEDSPIKDSTAATALATYAKKDLATPLADGRWRIPFCFFLELHDLLALEANDDHYDYDTDFALVGPSHVVDPVEGWWTEVELRGGKPAGAFYSWHSRAPAEAPGAEAGELEDGAVTTPKIADDAVTTPKIDDGAVTTPKLGDQAVLAAKLADDAVERAKILDGAVNDLKLANLAVTNAKLALAAVDTANVVDGAMTEVKVASGAITTTKIADDAISTPKLQALAITAGKLAAGAVVAGKLSAGAIDASSIIANGIITNALIATGTITGDRLVANTITAGQIAALTITAAEISAGAVTAAKISVSDLEAISANLGTITTGQLNSPDGNAYIRMQASQGWFIYAESGGVPTVQIGHNGSVTIRGTIYATSGEFSGTVTASAVVASTSFTASEAQFSQAVRVGGTLTAAGTVSVLGDQVIMLGADQTGPWLIFRNPNSNLDIHRSGVPYFYFDASGDAHCLQAGGTWNDASDVRLKRNIAEIPGNLARAAVRTVPAIRYRRTTANAPWEVGFSAQALQVVLPEAVRDTDRTVDGVPNAMSIAYGRITPVLWNAVRDIDQDLVLLRQAIRSATDLAHLKELIGV